jgi:aerobic C4-dicarboxylate transport protein
MRLAPCEQCKGARLNDQARAVRVGGKALLYFEIVTTFALAIGLIVVNVTRPGAGLAATTIAAAVARKNSSTSSPGAEGPNTCL